MIENKSEASTRFSIVKQNKTERGGNLIEI